MLEQLSIIIPLAENEKQHLRLLEQIADLCPEAEVILSQKSGRAQSLNVGIERATGSYLWFLHADSQLTRSNLRALTQSIEITPNALHFFSLGFEGKSTLMKVTAWGANFRSRVFGCPFGDQGFCLHKDQIQQVGLFNENVAYGEDHVFIWQCRMYNIPLSYIATPLITDARKYSQHGWLSTTLKHQYLWLKQAIPLWMKTEYHRAR